MCFFGAHDHLTGNHQALVQLNIELAAKSVSAAVVETRDTSMSDCGRSTVADDAETTVEEELKRWL